LTDESGMSEARVALVTGARRGIGRFLAKHLLDGGFRVVGCSRNPADWEAPNYLHVQADVAKEAEVRSLMRRISKLHGRLDAVINCAGAATMNHVLLTPATTLEDLLRTNVVGTFLVSREAVKLMRPRGFGRIVNFSSIAVPLRLEGQAAYVASKSAVVALTQVMARELAELGITLNVVGPPPIETDMIRGVPAQKIDRLVTAMPVKRLGTMPDVANVVDFFLRPESGAVTGQVVYLGGEPGGGA
jgi:3-oxoacyl-[acyl-carrier protein] reductase